MCISGRLHILRVLNLCLGGYGLPTIFSLSNIRNCIIFSPLQYCDFELLNYLPVLPEKFIMICWGNFAQNMRQAETEIYMKIPSDEALINTSPS